MPDRSSYNTRLRTNSLILPPKRLRHSPSPPPRRPTKSKLFARSNDAPPHFPPPNVVLHPDDAANKTLIAIGRAMLAVDNRAITIKDLSQLSLECGLLCQNVSAASQAITTFIRNHLGRCRQERAKPLLLSIPLTGTDEDDRLAPALHSRSGGTSSTKDPERSLTCFRRGTTVWYLSEVAGAPCPFKRAGLSVDDVSSIAHGTKRKRDTRQSTPRKCSTPGPAMSTRKRTQPDATTSGLCLRLTLKLNDPPPPSTSESESELSSIDSDSECDQDDAPSNPDRAPSMSVDTDESNSDSDPREEHVPVFSQDLPPYPILSASIPSPSCTTPGTSLASPSVAFTDPFLPLNCSPPLCSASPVFSSFRTALSNPPRDHRARSRSLPFSAASPPPDSEDEDEDYHNSMVGLRRGSVPLPLKKEEDLDTDYIIPKCEPVTPKYVPDPIYPVMKDWEFDHMTSHKHTDEGVSTPLELLPGFVFSEPDSASSVKAEPMSAVLPPVEGKVFRWADLQVKRESSSDDEQTVLDPDETLAPGKGTQEDPVRIDADVGDVEVLGPESVRSREWDAAWCSEAQPEERTVDQMDVDCHVDSARSLPDGELFARHEVGLCASPAETLATVPTTISSPPSHNPISIDGERDAPFLMHPLQSCDPPVVATVIADIPVYHTFLAPGIPLLRRIDNSFVNLTPLMTFLGLPLSALVAHTHPAPRMSISRAPEPFGGTWVPLSVAQGVVRHAGAGQVPPGVRDVFLSTDLGVWFPDALGRLVQLHGKSAAMRMDTGDAVVREIGIRVEDVFTGAEGAELKQDARLRHDASLELLPPVVLRMPGVSSKTSLFDSARPGNAPVSLSLPLDEQEETLFRSFVDYIESSAAPSSTSPPPSSPPPKPAVIVTVTTTSSAKEKENSTRSDGAPQRRKREKTVEVPVRRSKRAIALKMSAPVTRSRSKGT